MANGQEPVVVNVSNIQSHWATAMSAAAAVLAGYSSSQVSVLVRDRAVLDAQDAAHKAIDAALALEDWSDAYAE